MPVENNDKLEILLDKIADALILDEHQTGLVNKSTVISNQKSIRRGTIQSGRRIFDRLVLYQKDIKANKDDLELSRLDGENIETLKSISDNIIDVNTIIVDVNDNSSGFIKVVVKADETNGVFGTEEDVTELIITNTTNSSGETIQESINVSQFVPLEQSSSIVDVNTANEFLDTNIYELLPTGDTRQARILRFFQELNALLPPEPPQFDNNNDLRVDRNFNGDWVDAEEYSKNNSISYAQTNSVTSTIDEEDAFIHRLKSESIKNPESAAKPNDTFENNTIEDIYRTIEPYLLDILEGEAGLQDDRPIYQNQSDGYIKFRNPNQGIIIRGTNKEYIEGLDPNDPTWLAQTDDDGNVIPGTGFTITMWVRFLDRVSEGTLFNYGNPLRDNNPFGFRLDTYIIDDDENKDIEQAAVSGGGYSSVTGPDNPNGALFQDSNSERFIRLIVHDHVGVGGIPYTYGSHFGFNHLTKYITEPPNRPKSIPTLDAVGVHKLGMFTNVKIPTNLDEWYFICASFNPSVHETIPNVSVLNQEAYDVFKNDYNYWMNHIDPQSPDTLITNSGFGNKCKVEIISRTDLLRARGFRV